MFSGSSGSYLYTRNEKVFMYSEPILSLVIEKAFVIQDVLSSKPYVPGSD